MMKQISLLFLIFLLCQCGNGKIQNISENNAREIPAESVSEEGGIDLKSSEVEIAEDDQDADGESAGDENIDLEKEGTNLYMDPFDPDFITGKWQAEDYNEVSFETWFYVEDGYVSGQYCAMKADASRIDCGTQEEVDQCYLKSPYLIGARILELEVVSCYSMKKGKATIEPYGDGQIKWTLTEPPGEFGVDHFAAKEAILYKTTFDPWDED